MHGINKVFQTQTTFLKLKKTTFEKSCFRKWCVFGVFLSAFYSVGFQEIYFWISLPVNIAFCSRDKKQKSCSAVELSNMSGFKKNLFVKKTIILPTTEKYMFLFKTHPCTKISKEIRTILQSFENEIMNRVSKLEKIF